MKIGEPEKGNSGKASREAYEEWKKSQEQPMFSIEESVEGIKGKAGKLFEYFIGTLKDLISLGKNADNKLHKMVLLPSVSDRLKKDLKDKGVFLEDSYKHTIDNFAIKHTLNEHADESEVLRGQVPITEEDFELATDVIENYDVVDVEKKQ